MPSKKVNYTKPVVRERLKDKIMSSSKGGKPNQWSARKAQILSKEYEQAGGGYKGSKTKPQSSLSKWTKEEWGTKSGKPSVQGSKPTGERYLPKKARTALSSAEYSKTTAKKCADLKAGKQFSKQPKSIASKTSRYRGK